MPRVRRGRPCHRFFMAYFGLDVLEAAKKLDADFGHGLFDHKPTQEERHRLKAQQAQRQTDKGLVKALKDYMSKVYTLPCDYAHLLRERKEAHSPNFFEDMEKPSPLFVEACHKLYYVEYMPPTCTHDGYKCRHPRKFLRGRSCGSPGLFFREAPVFPGAAGNGGILWAEKKIVLRDRGCSRRKTLKNLKMFPAGSITWVSGSACRGLFSWSASVYGKAWPESGSMEIPIFIFVRIHCAFFFPYVFWKADSVSRHDLTGPRFLIRRRSR